MDPRFCPGNIEATIVSWPGFQPDWEVDIYSYLDEYLFIRVCTALRTAHFVHSPALVAITANTRLALVKIRINWKKTSRPYIVRGARFEIYCGLEHAQISNIIMIRLLARTISLKSITEPSACMLIRPCFLARAKWRCWLCIMMS